MLLPIKPPNCSPSETGAAPPLITASEPPTDAADGISDSRKDAIRASI